MKTTDIITENENRFSSTDEISQEDLRYIFDSVVSLSVSYKSTNFAAALFKALNMDDKIRYFNDVILKFYVSEGMPKPYTEEFMEFSYNLRNNFWKKVQKNDDVDYSNYDNVVSALF